MCDLQLVQGRPCTRLRRSLPVLPLDISLRGRGRCDVPASSINHPRRGFSGFLPSDRFVRGVTRVACVYCLLDGALPGNDRVLLIVYVERLANELGAQVAYVVCCARVACIQDECRVFLPESCACACFPMVGPNVAKQGCADFARTFPPAHWHDYCRKHKPDFFGCYPQSAHRFRG